MTSLRFDVELMHPPALVWRGLTEAKPLNEWFQPIAGWPESGARAGSQGRVFPTDDLRGFGSFDMDVVEAEPHSRLVCRWLGEDFTSEITFELKPVPGGGSRLLVRQAGFLGTQEIERRETLARAHRVMFERLLATLDRLALGLGEGAFLQAESPMPARSRLKGHHRIRLVSLACVVLITGLCGTAGAVWMNRGSAPASAPGAGGSARPSLGSGAQEPVASASPTRSAAVGGTKESNAPSVSPPTAPASAPSSAKPLAASYQIRKLPVGLLGFDTEVTVRNPGDRAKNGWTVVLTMPDATVVQNQSGQVVKVKQDNDVVTVTPVTAALPAGGSVSFIIRYPALLTLGPTIKGCTIDGKACGAA